MNERRDVTQEEQRAAASTATADEQRAAARTPTADKGRVPVERGEISTGEEQPAGAQAQTRDIELLPRDTLEDFQGRWERIQVMFVDQPRDAVQQAHDLVDQLVDQLTQSFGKQREGLMGTWTRGGDVSTEDLRLALQRYRSFFNRLLST